MIPGGLMPIPGFPDYFASREGAIYSTKYGAPRRLKDCLIEPSPGNRYYRYTLRAADGRLLQTYGHTLIALTFIGPRPEGMGIDHINNNGLDNRAENLRYATPKQNSNNLNNRPNAGQLRKAGKLPLAGAVVTGERHMKLTPADVGEIKTRLAAGEAVKDLASMFGVHVQTIYLIKSGKRRAEIAPAPRQTQGEGEAA